MSAPAERHDRLRAELARAGLNLLVGLDPEVYDAEVPVEWSRARVAPGRTGVALLANGGPELWRRFRGEGIRGPDPLDRFVERSVHAALGGDAEESIFVSYRDARGAGHLPLQRLALGAGLGALGRIGLVIHPEYGPWTSLRGVLFLPWQVPVSVQHPDFAPCDGCPAPCRDACPGEAVGADLDLVRCAGSRGSRECCRVGCDARAACVVGREHAFPAEAVRFHSLALPS